MINIRYVIKNVPVLSFRKRIESVGGKVLSYEEALSCSNLVFVAIPFEGFSSLPGHLLQGKILIDVSNR